jgi:hypothetical protein
MFEIYDGQADATDAMEEAAAALARTEAGRKPRGARNRSASLQRGRTGTRLRGWRLSDSRYAGSLIVRLRVGFAFSGCGSLIPAMASSRSRIARALCQSSHVPSPGRAYVVRS